jgi:hypothetical protein
MNMLYSSRDPFRCQRTVLILLRRLIASCVVVQHRLLQAVYAGRDHRFAEALPDPGLRCLQCHRRSNRRASRRPPRTRLRITGVGILYLWRLSYHLTEYCAITWARGSIGQYSTGLHPNWSCPLTPFENRLRVPIRAGEQIFDGATHE